MTIRPVQEQQRIARLMSQAIDPEEVGEEEGAHAVYRISSDDRAGSYRFGEYPRRHAELARQFEKVEIVALFWDEETARTVSAYLNGAW